ncbi:hypothetical protein LY76DRAFT_245168 [Colletotrichum caudatum]|nr:hypothetical protein LY76DRAFT_245168 [Colletotrichum caudatum]
MHMNFVCFCTGVFPSYWRRLSKVFRFRRAAQLTKADGGCVMIRPVSSRPVSSLFFSFLLSTTLFVRTRPLWNPEPPSPSPLSTPWGRDPN